MLWKAVRKLQLSYELDPKLVAARRGTYVTDADCDAELVVGAESVDVFRPDGSWLLSCRIGVYDANRYQHLVMSIAGMRGGVDGRRGSAVHRDAIMPLLCKDGLVSASSVHHVPRLRSLGDAASFRFGFTGATGLNPYARQTGDWKRYPEVLDDSKHFLRMLDSAYRGIAPEAYQKLIEAAANIPWLLPDTRLSSVTINRNWQPSLHRDIGDFGPAVATVLMKGEPKGADLVFLRYCLPVRLRPGNVLVADTHELHGNTPLYGVLGQSYRISFFAYLHKSVLKCGSSPEEAERRQRWLEQRRVS